MRQISPFPFFIGVFLSSILIILLYAVRKRKFFIKQFGISSIAMVYLICIGRMALPFEFPFTYVIVAKSVLNPVIDILYADAMIVGTYPVMIIEILLLVWICVTAVLLVRFIGKYRSASKWAALLPKQHAKHLQEVMNRIQSTQRRSMSVQIMCSNEVSSPFSIGLIKKQVLLPERDYSATEVYYIFLHEYTHFMNRDLLVKMAVHIFTCIFWWNPAVYLLQKDLEQVLEMKCDVTIVSSLNKHEKADYLKAMLSELLKKEMVARDSQVPGVTASFVGQRAQTAVEERFQYVKVFVNKKGSSSLPGFVVLGIVLLLFLSSYLIVFQSEFETPIEEIETDAGAYSIDDDIYIKENKDGTYEFVGPFGSTSIDGKTAEEHIEAGRKLIEE